jgi:hypothetical protein
LGKPNFHPKERKFLELITNYQQQVLLGILATHTPQLAAYPGVHYVDIGYKYVHGALTGQLALRMHVRKKQARSRLSIGQLLPELVNGLLTDVIQSNRCLESTPGISRDFRFNPLVGGIAIRNTRNKVLGTLGAIVRDLNTQTYVGLTNYHVLVGNFGQTGDPVTQPATTNINDIIGSVARWDQQLDCALCSLNSSRLLSRNIIDIPDAPTGIKEPLLGMKVTKSGRTTGTTSGIIDGVSADEFTVIPIPERQHLNEEISAAGDSGSIWLDNTDGNAVGLHYAGEKDPAPQSERAWAKKLSLITAVLNIAF